MGPRRVVRGREVSLWKAGNLGRDTDDLGEWSISTYFGQDTLLGVEEGATVAPLHAGHTTLPHISDLPLRELPEWRY